MKIQTLNKATGALLIFLSILVAIPLAIKTIVTNGGTWGFGIVGIPILFPLSAYLLFGISGWIDKEAPQRRFFISAHLITLVIGLISLFVFPVYPKGFVLIPLALAIFSMVSKKNYRYFLLVMILLGIVANSLLLKWEIDFDRSVPLFQFFESSNDSIP